MGRLETESVIDRIEEIRKEKKISQLKLCDIACISRSHFYYITEKKVSPTLDTLDRLADAMGVSMAEFFKPSRWYLKVMKQYEKAEKEGFFDYPDLVQQWLLLHPEVAEEYGVDTSAFPGAEKFLKKIEKEKASAAKDDNNADSPKKAGDDNKNAP